MDHPETATSVPAGRCADDECDRPYSDHIGPGNVGHPFRATSTPAGLLETLADHLDGFHGECHCRRKLDEAIG